MRESQRENELLANILQRASQPFAVGYPDGRLGLLNRAFEELTPAARGATAEAQEAVRSAIRRWFRRETGKRPTVLPIVLEL